MLTRSPPPPQRAERNPQRHLPAVPVLAAVSSGIVADWYLGLESRLWITAAVGCVVLWAVAFALDTRRLSAFLLLLGCALTGATAHHCRWSLVPVDELLSYATDRPRPVRLRGTIETIPVVIPARPNEFPTGMPPRDRTVADLQALALIVEGRRETIIPVAGRVRLDVQGTLSTPLPRGTEVELWGMLSRPGLARNPGGFDFRLFLREKGIHTLVRCEFPECITVRSLPVPRSLPDVSVWQSVIAERLRKHLSTENAPLAIALLLGPRTDISQELKEAFLQSGMVHFLAISGINVAILVGFLWPLVRLTRLPRGGRLFVVGLCVAGYVTITDADPPVVRAAVLVGALLLSLASGRPLAPLNQLAIAALLILIGNPHDLFQVGAQLSFLAIVALQWLISLDRTRFELKVDPLDQISQMWFQTALHRLRGMVWAGFLATCAVWIFTLPLVLARFHLVSPVGFLVNVFLSFWMTLTLGMGYVNLLGAILCPQLLYPCALVFDVFLSGFVLIVRSAASIPWGHFKVPGPSDLWLAVFYVTILATGGHLLGSRLQCWNWRFIVAWCVAGLAWALLPESNPGLRCTFLSVGHGVAVLIELPNRQTILYDAGSLEDGARARQVVESALLARGQTRLDAMLISHADIDHFNAVHGLVESIPIGGLYISPTFLDFQQSSVRITCEAARAAGVPVKLLWAGDRLRCDGGVELQVLAPPAAGLGTDDNANSIVLSIRFAGRSVLLTGDLEKAGLQSLLRQTPAAHDILLAPHHGSLKANPPDLARWVTPRWVVVSGGGDTSLDKLQQNYGDGVVLLSTARLGAVTFEITPRGEIDVATHLHPTRNIRED